MLTTLQHSYAFLRQILHSYCRRSHQLLWVLFLDLLWSIYTTGAPVLGPFALAPQPPPAQTPPFVLVLPLDAMTPPLPQRRSRAVESEKASQL